MKTRSFRHKDQADAIRQKVHDHLVNAYFEHPAVEVFVVPLSEEGITSMGKKRSAVVRDQIKPGQDITTTVHGTIGVGIHRGSDELDTVIVIDTVKEGRKIADAEIAAASAMFVAIATAIDWAAKSRR